MENRRENFRHEFDEAKAIPAEFELFGQGKTLAGRIISLSATGAGIQAVQDQFPMASHDRISLRFRLPKEEFHFQLRAIIRYAQKNEGGWFYGVQFLPSENSTEDAERDRRIWRFLMEMQRRSQRPANPAS